MAAKAPMSKVELRISCRRLLNKDTMSKSDPCAVLYVQDGGNLVEVSYCSCQTLFGFYWSVNSTNANTFQVMLSYLKSMHEIAIEIVFREEVFYAKSVFFYLRLFQHSINKL